MPAPELAPPMSPQAEAEIFTEAVQPPTALGKVAIDTLGIEAPAKMSMGPRVGLCQSKRHLGVI
jgi:hypothetical protein